VSHKNRRPFIGKGVKHNGQKVLKVAFVGRVPGAEVSGGGGVCDPGPGSRDVDYLDYTDRTPEEKLELRVATVDRWAPYI